jgi:hypothetical protein
VRECAIGDVDTAALNWMQNAETPATALAATMNFLTAMLDSSGANEPHFCYPLHCSFSMVASSLLQ